MDELDEFIRMNKSILYNKIEGGKQILKYLKELKELRNESLIYSKALDMMAEELAMNKHCKMFPNCYLESDQENCQLIKECHDKEWLKQYYIEKASEEE